MRTKTVLSNTVAALLLQEDELEHKVQELEMNILKMQPVYDLYCKTYLYGVKKEQAVKHETDKLKRNYGKSTLSLSDVSTHLGIDSATLEMLFIDKRVPFTFVYFPSCDDGDVFFVPIEAFAEYIVDHSIDRWTEE